MSFKLVQGGNKPRPYRAERGGAGQWTCSVCEQATGVPTSEIIAVLQSPMEQAGKVKGGIKVHVCLHCLMRGVVTRV